jgi:hypothetical protein
MYSMDGRTFNTIEELYEYQRQAYPQPTATEENWAAFDPNFAGQIGLSEPQWNSLVEQINAARQGQIGPIPVGPQGSHGTSFAVGPDATPQELWESVRGLAYKQMNPDAYPDPVNTQRAFLENIAKTGGLLMGGAALGGAFAGAGAGATGGAAGADALTGVPLLPEGVGYMAGGAFPTTPLVAGASIPALQQLPTQIGTNAAIDAFTGMPGGTSLLNAGGGGGGMFENLLSGGLGDWAPLIGGLLGAVDANNQPNSMTQSTGGTSSSTYGSTLPNEIQAPAIQALASLQQHMSNGGGYQAAGVDPMTYQALAQLQNRGTNPFASGGLNNTAATQSGFATGQYNNTEPTSSAFATGGRANTTPTMSGFATGQYNNTAPTASGFAGGQTINPYLDQVFNAAADSTQNRMATEFAHAGGGALNSGSHQQARLQDLSHLAAGIYGPGFESERNRQYGAQESSVDRLLAQMEGNLGRQYGAQESGLSRLLAQMEGNLGREYGAAESGLSRQLSQTDSNLARQYGAQESGLDRLYAQMEANLGRQYGATEGNLNRDMAAIYPMLQGGEYLRNVQQQQLDAPNMAFNQYMQQLQVFVPFFPGTQTQNTSQTGQVTQPLFNNPLAGFLGGAQLGSLFQG